MKYEGDVREEVVFGLWAEIQESTKLDNPRSDIINKTFPRNLVRWHLAKVEQSDISRIWMLPVSDFMPLAGPNWRLQDAIANFDSFNDRGIVNSHSERFDRLISRQGGYERRLILASPQPQGPFVILDGNHRAVLLGRSEELVGNLLFVGVHPQVDAFNWTFNLQPQWRRLPRR